MVGVVRYIKTPYPRVHPHRGCQALPHPTGHRDYQRFRAGEAAPTLLSDAIGNYRVVGVLGIEDTRRRFLKPFRYTPSGLIRGRSNATAKSARTPVPC